MSSLEPDTAEVCVPVNTDIASALVVVEESMSTDMESSAAITAAMELVSRDLRRKQQGVQDDIEEFTEDDIDLARIPTVERDLDRILEKRNEFRNGVRDFLEDYGEHIETSAQATWRNSITALNAAVKTHAKKIKAKVHEICPPKPLTQFEEAQLDLQARQLALLEANASKEHDTSVLKKQAEKLRALALA